MRESKVVGVLAIVFFMSDAVAASAGIADQDPPHKSELPSANAALKYWQAFSHLRFPSATFAKVERTSTDAGIGDRLDDELRKVATSTEVRYALQAMRRGTTMPYCDWGLEFDLKQDGPETILPHLSEVRELMRYALLRARYQFEESQFPEGVDHVVETIILGRHVFPDRIISSWFTGHALENVAIFVVSPYLPTMSEEALDRLSQRLTTLPEPASLQDVIQHEREIYVNWLTNKIQQADGLADLLEICRSLTNTTEDEAVNLLEDVGTTTESFLQRTSELDLLCNEAAEASALPMNVSNTRRVEELQKRIDSHPVGRLIPNVVRVRHYNAISTCKRKMLEAAIEVVLRGRAALENHPDPYGEETFDYVPFEGGFELRSELKLSDGSPVTLTFGRDRR